METPQKVGMEYVQPINRDVPEPKTPVRHLKYEQGEDASNSFKARSTGIKVTCLSLALHILSIHTCSLSFLDELYFFHTEIPSSRVLDFSEQCY
jgi:hypothetical protein